MTHRTEQCCKECSGWEPALHECSCQCHYSHTDESVVSPTIPERVEEIENHVRRVFSRAHVPDSAYDAIPPIMGAFQTALTKAYEQGKVDGHKEVGVAISALNVNSDMEGDWHAGVSACEDLVDAMELTD